MLNKLIDRPASAYGSLLEADSAVSLQGFYGLREEFIPTGVMVGNVYDKNIPSLAHGCEGKGSVRARALPQSESLLKRTSPKGFHVLREEFIPTGAMVGKIYDKKMRFHQLMAAKGPIPPPFPTGRGACWMMI